MLLFIRNGHKKGVCSCSFNTSHVVIYQTLLLNLLFKLFCFNTSHVVIYLTLILHYVQKGIVSIHLMLLFINGLEMNHKHIRKVSIHLMLLFIPHWVEYIHTQFLSFNTSHVVIYQLISFQLCAIVRVSIHLMLLFIFTNILKFTNIFSVSIHLMLLFIRRQQ